MAGTTANETMRSVTVLVTPPEGYPVARLFADAAGVRRERIYNLAVLEDGTMVLLGRIRGDLTRVREMLAETPAVLGATVSEQDGERGLVFVHVRPPPSIKRLLELRSEHGVFFEFPIEATEDGRFEITMIGETNSELTAILEEIPPELDVGIERVGPFIEDPQSLPELLTDRQREVLDVALERGYYDVPRRATHRDIAEALDVSAPTVSEHLQKIEARVFGAIRP